MSLNAKLINDLNSEAVEWRHYLHQHPELSFKEFETTKFIQRKLVKWGFKVDRSLSKTGLIAMLKSGSSQKNLAIRADIDALHLGKDNVTHACGHDGHTAILLGAAKYLSQTQNFNGSVYLVFQAAEEGGGKEGPSGAQQLVKSGLFDKYPIQRFFTLHNVPTLPENVLSIKKGALLAGHSHFYFQFFGQGGHASHPEKTVNSLLPLAQTISKISQQLPPPAEKVGDWAVAVTGCQAGTAVNTIPECASGHGSLRTFDSDLTSELKRQIEQIVQIAGDKYSATSKVRFVETAPPVINDGSLVETCWTVAERVNPPSKIKTEDIRVLSADDFAYYLSEVPGCYVSLGTGTDIRVHTSEYQFNDRVIKTGIKFWVELIQTVLSL